MISNFFNPKSVAVLGASATPGKVGYDVLKNLIQSNYKGKVYPVNPKSSEIQGLKTYPGLSDIKENIIKFNSGMDNLSFPWYWCSKYCRVWHRSTKI